jgi:hypothetical protein
MMQPDVVQETPTLETRVRFSLRSILIGTAVVAVAVALLAPWFRQWNAEQRKAFVLVWCNVAFGAGITVIAGCIQRVRAEKRAGPVHYRLPLSTTGFGSAWAIGMALFMLSIVIGYSLFRAMPPGGGTPALPVDFVAIQCGITFGLAGLGLWLKTACLELCDAGMLSASHFIPWKLIRYVRWGGSDPNLLVVQRGLGVTTARANPADKQAIDQFLQRRMADNFQQAKY